MNKNRTDGRYDRRWFSAVYLVVRIAFHVFTAKMHELILLLLYMTFLLIFTARIPPNWTRFIIV